MIRMCAFANRMRGRSLADAGEVGRSGNPSQREGRTVKYIYTCEQVRELGSYNRQVVGRFRVSLGPYLGDTEIQEEGSTLSQTIKNCKLKTIIPPKWKCTWGLRHSLIAYLLPCGSQATIAF